MQIKSSQLFILYALFACLNGNSLDIEDQILKIRESVKDNTSVSIYASPSFELPVGESSDYFDFGVSGTVAGEYCLTFEPGFFVSGGIDYQFNPIKAYPTVSLVSAKIGAGAYLEFIPRFFFKAFCDAGYYYSRFNETKAAYYLGDASSPYGFNPSFDAGLGVYYLLDPAYSIGINASYRNYIGIYQGLSLSISSSFFLTGQENRKAKVEIANLKNIRIPKPGEGIKIEINGLSELFPSLRKIYVDHPIGKITIKNQEKNPIKDILVTFYIKELMDSPAECAANCELGNAEEKQIHLFANFGDKVLKLKERADYNGEIILKYNVNGTWYKDLKTASFTMYDRNAIEWTDDNKAACFVTSTDPTVLAFAKNVCSLVSGEASPQINPNLCKAMAIHEGITLFGVRYVSDPKTAFSKAAKKHGYIDFLQFPRETLAYKGGDCDDLSALYCALLESAGIETAFITIPGHIFAAFEVCSAREIKKYFNETSDFIIRNGKAWIPVEVTDRASGFLNAWREGMLEWNENAKTNEAGFFPVHAAWEVYEPVAFPHDEGSDLVILISEDKLIAGYSDELGKFVKKDINRLIAACKNKIDKSPENISELNKLGVLYGKYMLTNDARETFGRILEIDSRNFNALVNMANVCYMEDDYKQALYYYDKANAEKPDSPAVLLCKAKTQFALERFDDAKKTFEILVKLAPAYNEKYGYLASEKERAKQAVEDIPWQE